MFGSKKKKEVPVNKFDWKTAYFWKDGTGSIFLAVLIALTIRWAILEAYVIPSGSMLPSLLINDHIFVNKMVYGLRVPFSEEWLVKFSEPKRGDVIVFKYPEDMSTFFIKRVVGEPGDKVEVRNGTLFINDLAMEKKVPPQPSDMDWLRDVDFQRGGRPYDTRENYVHYIESLPGSVEHNVLQMRGESFNNNFGPITVPADHLFMMGDNRDNSKDSRFWGSLPKANILGRASFVWLSCEDTIRFSAILPINVESLDHILCNPLTIRWRRFFHSVN